MNALHPFRSVRAVAAIALIGLTACGDGPTGPTVPPDVTFAPSLNIDLSTFTQLPGQLYIRTEQEGEGNEILGGPITVAYTLWLPDGTEIDSATEYSFNLSGFGVIPGFGIGIRGMTVGEIRTIVVPSTLGYGRDGAPGIPANSVLVFRVELLSTG